MRMILISDDKPFRNCGQAKALRHGLRHVHAPLPAGHSSFPNMAFHFIPLF